MKDDKSIQNLCLHTHNIFCDGKQNINTLVNNAISQEVAQIGISSHAPIKFSNTWNMDIDKLDDYLFEIQKAQQSFGSQIEIFTSLEIDYIPHHSYTFDFFRKKLPLDYTIGSIHLVAHPNNGELWFIDGSKKECIENMNRIFEGDVKTAVSSFFTQTREMINTQKPDIIGHLDKVIMNTADFFDESDSWYQEEINKTLAVIKQSGTIVEANTRGLYKGKWNDSFPSKAILKKCFDLDIPVTISSDAHHSDELLLAYTETRTILKSIGYKYLQGRKNGKWGKFPV
jgi:histidinol-phosphatase (PHP family)